MQASYNYESLDKPIMKKWISI